MLPDPTGVIAAEFAKNKIKKIPQGWNTHFADSANPDKIKSTNQTIGSRFVGANKVKLKVEFYIDFLNQCKAIYIYPNAQEFKREAGKWEYIKGSDSPRKLYDDINDAIRYALQPVLLAKIGQNTSIGRIKL